LLVGTSALPRTSAAAPLTPAEDKACERTITVIGHGEVTAKPDALSTTLGVEAKAPTVAEAMRDATARMNAVIAALKGAGVAERDLRTTHLSVGFERQPEAGPEAGPRGSYRVTNLVEVKIRDINVASAVLDAAVRAGANDVYGISFAVDDPAIFEMRARKTAMADARMRAESLADWSGVRLGPVLSISETVGAVPRPMFVGHALRAEGGPPMEPGELRMTAQVQVVYALVQAKAQQEGS
jgi:uncharacterized protein YggE